ncbi:hypothetical protein JQ615_01225 [Bradyrhizobium jicamae]|uniref:Peptidase M48 domain-containing protein n=1 Tax=Bradyrhizobium jicamae TaxID=280332 RepID=A0ABS5FB47_9BRAD|nr:hypothetical protein [Bradyrhizobium jicamae]MBR0794003.1 hypothetical protein [Bradyrhizobium jicamae]
MDPAEFLREEYKSVDAALKETLRHDYGPTRGVDYFNECKFRLDEINETIEDPAGLDGPTIAAQLRSLSALGSRICLIERSRLGEFSWPFAEAIREIAEKLFVERHLDGEDYLPIVHVIAEGMHYQIVDDVQPPTGKRRIMVVAFPRQLKHHVLLHALFGHELAHIAQASKGPGRVIALRVMSAMRTGAFSDETQATAWLRRSDAPHVIASELKAQPSYLFPAQSLQNWRIEIICDLFGLLLFGPSFAAAHRMILEPVSSDPAAFDLKSSTHPPFSIRRRAITQAMRLLGWHRPVSNAKDGDLNAAERKFLAYASETSKGKWQQIFSDNELKIVLDRLSEIFRDHPQIRFSRPHNLQLKKLVEQLTLCRPPIVQAVGADGIAVLDSVRTIHCLYAGWTFWFGREKLRAAKLANYPRLRELDFLNVNKLCDQALLQQKAIDLVKEASP